MSHVVKVSTSFLSLDALERAVTNKNGKFMRDQKTAAYYGGATHKCQHAIKVPGTTYEVGLNRKAQADEEWEASYDHYDHTIDRVFGRDLSSLKVEYNAVVAEQQLEAARYRFVRETVEGDPQAIRVRAVE